MSSMKYIIFAMFCCANFSFASGQVYPSGPANIIPTESKGKVMLWVGGNVGMNLFEGMTSVTSEFQEGVEFRVGKNIACFREIKTNDVVYSCQLVVTSDLGSVIKN